MSAQITDGRRRCPSLCGRSGPHKYCTNQMKVLTLSVYIKHLHSLEQEEVKQCW